MPTCPQCHRPLQSGLSSCPQCDSASADDGVAPDDDPDPGGFETGSRRRMRARAGARTAQREPGLRLLPRIHGALALNTREAEESGLTRNAARAPERRPQRTAEVVPLHRPAERIAPRNGAVVKAQRPPVLASEALRRELLPATPAARAGRTLLALVGCVGVAVSVAVGTAHGLGVPLGGTFLALTLVGLLPMTYQARAAATCTLAGSGLCVVAWAQLRGSGELSPLLLLVAVGVLATALLFRSWHRASRLARGLCAVGIALGAGWLWDDAILSRLLVLEGAWHAWLPPLMATPLPVLLLLSLLAFMDARSTGGCSTWASLLLTWYALFSGASLFAQGWPVHASAFALERVAPEAALALLGAPLFEIAVALGLAQLVASARADATTGNGS